MDENAVRRVDRLIVDTELTDRILKARILRAKLGHWPSELPGAGESRLVNARWIYAVDPHERLAIALSRELDWGRQLGPVLPVRYESEK